MATRVALAYSAQIAAEYASTTDPEVFRAAAQATLKIPERDILEIQGVSLPWENRPKYQIYIAAPDFKRIDRTPIKRLVESLEYHNFAPRRPIVEYGEMEVDANADDKQRLCDADLSLFDNCAIMVAVLLFDDPGTLIEIGIAVQRRMPVIVYDPYDRAENLMLTQLPNLVSSSLDKILAAVFRFVALESQK